MIHRLRVLLHNDIQKCTSELKKVFSTKDDMKPLLA